MAGARRGAEILAVHLGRFLYTDRAERHPMTATLSVIPYRPALRVPGYLSVRAAAERLGIRERSLQELIERRRLPSSRLGRLHFLPSAAVEAYRGGRRERSRRVRARQRARVQRLARAA